MVVAEISLMPIGRGESIGDYVARCLDIVDRSGLSYRCHAMGTELEGEFDAVMNVVRDCFQALAADCDRVHCAIRLDYRKGATGELDSRVRRIVARLGRPVRQ